MLPDSRVLSTLKTLLKRGALVAAANWPVVLIQATAEALFKLLIAAPIIGGIVLVALVVGADPAVLVALEWHALVPTLVAALQARPLALVSFLAAVGVVVTGGSLFVFLVKAGTVSVLVRSEREAGPIEQPPLQFEVVAGASRFSVEGYIESARTLFPAYARLGLLLLGVYGLSGTAYLLAVLASDAGGWAVTGLITLLFALWISVVNLVYLLLQIVLAVEGCRVATAARRVAGFLASRHRDVLSIFLVVLALVIFATGASVLATFLLGLIAFVPFVGLAVLPLQLLAWLLRALVFQYIGLASLGAYGTLYRGYAAGIAPARAPAPDALWPADLGPQPVDRRP